MDDLLVAGYATLLDNRSRTLHSNPSPLDDRHADRIPADHDFDVDDLEIDLAQCEDSHDCGWVITIDNQVVGQVSVVHEDSRVARIDALRIHPGWRHTSVLAKLIDCVHRHCWDHGYLKVLLEPKDAPMLARRMLEHRGFHLVRRHAGRGGEVFEYYVDLYFTPRHEGSGM